MTKKRLAWAAGLIGAAALAVGLALFEPWTLFTDKEVNEALPDVRAIEEPEDPSSDPTGPEATAEPPSGPATLSTGAFVDAEHATSGTARIIELADGRRVLRLENLDTSNGPDLHVWLSDKTPGGSWFKYDDDRYVALGDLKGNQGNQNYEIPDSVDLSQFRSAVIWCDRFNVAFGAAPVKVA